MPELSLQSKNVLVLGAYGFIGAAVTRALAVQGAQVTGMVRNLETGGRVLPGVALVQGDLRDLTGADDWQGILSQFHTVVNCAGALQDGPQDDLEAVHHRAIAALGEACAKCNIPMIQISATDARPEAETEFMRTKAAGDAALKACGAEVWILKPGLVIGQSDFGGTMLLRMLAAVPWVQPLAYPETPVQCVGMSDLCDAVVLAVRGDIPPGSYDLVEETPHPFSEVLSETRRWLGFPAARATFAVPRLVTQMIAAAADLLGRAGWRSPLRSTAMVVMAKGVAGDPGPYCAASGRQIAGLQQIYDGLTCGREHRLSARMNLLLPIAVGMLSLFWMLSGVLGLISLTQAAEVLTRAGWSMLWASSGVVFWSLVDIALGLGLLWRPWTARICLMQVVVALFYLLAATVAVPSLWADPLGPLVKILPMLLLPLFVRTVLESR